MKVIISFRLPTANQLKIRLNCSRALVKKSEVLYRVPGRLFNKLSKFNLLQNTLVTRFLFHLKLE
jgi:hypothetical protein